MLKIGMTMDFGNFASDLEGFKSRYESSVMAFIEREGDRVEKQYKSNLSGSATSTPARPLPVGIKTGELIGGVRVDRTEDSFTVYNVAPHAAHIEFGTSRMTPRAPLGDTMGKMQDRFDAGLANVGKKIFKVQ